MVRRRERGRGASILASVILSCLAAPALAASAAGGEPNLKLNGFWNVDADARLDGLYGIKAPLTPAGQEIARRNAEAAQARIARGEPVGLGSYTCGRQSVPFIVGTSEPWLLVVTDDEVVQVAERRQMTPRHFYTDGRSWPDFDKMPPSASGYSLAHWEGDDLVVETRDLPPGGGVQGGGLKGPKTVLTERVSLDASGDRLKWTYTWTDPDLYAEPFSYSLFYDRAPEHLYAFTHPCDPNKDAGATVDEPPQD